MIDPSLVVETARLSLNTPYQHQGRKSRVGLDCIGLVVVTGHALGLFDVDPKNYSRIPNGTFKQEVEKYCTPLETLQVGALALFKISTQPHHCGIITQYQDDWGLIHAYQNVGRVREHRLINWWREKMIGIYALPNVNYQVKSQKSKVKSF